jgi:heat shock protein HslJ
MSRRGVLVVTSITVVLVIALAFLVATAAHASSATLTGQPWTLSKLVVDGQEHALSSSYPITLNFESQDSSISGSAGCNSYGGAYTLAGNQLSFGNMRSTLAFCENDDIMVREFAYLDALGRVESYHLDGDTLTLQGDNGQVLMTFQPKAST